jgi:hypothetical protein
MDFLERVFHVDPDGGNGTLEALYIVVAALLVIVVSKRKAIISAVRGLMRR